MAGWSGVVQASRGLCESRLRGLCLIVPFVLPVIPVHSKVSSQQPGAAESVRAGVGQQRLIPFLL